jgi:hypothetical protein
MVLLIVEEWGFTKSCTVDGRVGLTVWLADESFDDCEFSKNLRSKGSQVIPYLDNNRTSPFRHKRKKWGIFKL